MLLCDNLLNVLILSEQFWPEGRGAELATYLYAKQLAQVGMNISVITIKPSPAFNYGRIKIYQLHVPFPGDQTKYGSMLATQHLLKKKYLDLIKQSDVVYISKWCWPIPLIQALGKPTILHVHEYSPICPIATFYDFSAEKVCDGCRFPKNINCILSNENVKGSSLGQTFLSMVLNLSLGRLYSRLASYADAVIFVSKKQREIVLRHIPHIAGKSYVLYNPIPSINYVAMKGYDFGYFGGIDRCKGFLVLLEALRYCRSTIHIAGSNVSSNKFMGYGEIKKKLRIHGWLVSREMEQLYEELSCVIFPSILEEPSPYIVIEAMLRGRLVIASDVGGVSEITSGSPGTFLSKPGDPFQLSKRIHQIESMSLHERNELGIKNRQHVITSFGNSSSAEKLIHIMDELV
jgi:glycosyltransferase involved in cell wall biosynthesis